MKKAFLIAAVIMAIFATLANTNTEAGKQNFAERFVINGKTLLKGDSGTYDFDKAHSFISFRIKHMGLIEVPGYFRDFSGKVNYNAEDVTKSTVEFSAKTASIDTGVDNRDNHLRSGDFFDVEKNPELTFKSTKVAKKGKGFVVTGDLTIKGNTKSISIPFTINGFLPGGEKQGARMGISAETTINRRDFGITYGGNLPGTNTPVLSDNVKVSFEIEAAQPAAQTAGN